MKVTTATLLLALASAPVFAQAPATATLRGRVTDPQGAVVAGASVDLRATATGVRRKTVADNRGTFVLTDLAPGSYVLRVQASTFAPKEYPPITLQVGQNAEVTLKLEAAALSEKVEVTTEALAVQSLSSVVQGVLASNAIERLPLNGRNFLELAFLVPGNSPAPNFDPTKTNTVVVSSAGQLGRGGNVTIDGAGQQRRRGGRAARRTCPQDAVQEFQIATNRFSAEQSAARPPRPSTWSPSRAPTPGTGLGRLLPARQMPCRACRPPTTAPRAGAALRPPAVRAVPRRTARQGQGLLVRRGRVPRTRTERFWWAQRDLATRTIRRQLRRRTPRPTSSATARLDWTPSGPTTSASATRTRTPTTPEPAPSIARSARPRSARPAPTGTTRSPRPGRSVVGTRSANTLSASWTADYRNADRSDRPRPPAHVPEHPGRRVASGCPRARTRTAARSSDTLLLGPRGPRAPLRRRGAARRGFLRPRRLPRGPGRAGAGLPELRPQRRRAGRRQRPPLRGHPAQRHSRPRPRASGDCNNTHIAVFVQDDWRVHPQLTLNVGLRYELDTDVKNISGYGDINPLVQPFLQGDRKRDSNNFGAPRRLQLVDQGRPHERPRRLRHLLRPGDARDHLARARPRRPGPADRGPGGQRVLPRPHDRPVPALRADLLRVPSAGFILPGRRRLRHQHHRQHAAEPARYSSSTWASRREWGATSSCGWTALHNLGTHFIIGRTIGRGLQSGGGRARPGHEPRVEREHEVRRPAGLRREALRRAAAGCARPTRSRKAFNYANDDQIPFSNGPIDPNDLGREYGPTPNDQRHRFTFAGSFSLPWRPARLPALDPGLGGAYGHPDAGRQLARPHAASGTPAAGSSRPRPT